MARAWPDTIASAETSVRLHMDRFGAVWYGHEDAAVGYSGLGPVEFVRQAGRFGIRLYKARALCLVGSRANASLLLALQGYRCRHPVATQRQRLLVVSPLSFLPSGYDDPVQVLHSLLQPELGCRLSGSCHVLTPLDCCSYAMAAALDGTDKVASRVTDLLRHHPAWPALSFLPTLDESAACRFISTIIDPRWFRHPTRPGRLSRLHAWLGLTRRNVAAYMRGYGQCDRHSDRFVDLVSLFVSGSRRVDLAQPGNFLLRILDSTPDEVTGLLRACQRLVRFVVEVWLAELGPSYEFLAESFFKDPLEVTAYQAHRRGLGLLA